MKRKYTLKTYWSLKLLLFLLCSVVTLYCNTAFAQTKIFANTAVNVANVDNANNATLNDDSFATINSSGFLLNYYEGELRLSFNTDVPANRTTFVRIGYDKALLDALLGGNLGTALSKVLGALVIGNHYFNIKALTETGDVVASGSSSGSFTTSNIRLITDASGNYYLAITPTAAYRTISIRDITQGLIAGTNELKVYSAFYVPTAGNCETAFGTDYEGSGVTLSLLGLGGAGVTNINQAIDGNPTTFSKMSLGLVTVAGTISQNVYFSAPSKIGDEFNIRLRVAADLLNVGLLDRLTVEAYNGNNLVYTAGNVSSLLSLDLLGLLNSGNAVTIPFSPNVAFDRVKLTLSSVLKVNVVQGIEVYEVTRSAPRPTFVAPNANAITACYNTTASLKSNTAATNQLLWYDSQEGGNLLSTTAYNGTYTTAPLTASKTYYVAAKTIDCPSESVRVPVVVTVNPQIIFPNTTLTNGMLGVTYSKQLTAASGGTAGYTYNFAAGTTPPPGLTLSSSGLLSGNPTQSGNFNFTIEVKDSKGCSVSQAKTLVINEKLTLATGALQDGIVSTIYPGETIPAATGGSGSYQYTATGIPAGLVFNESTREITGTPTTLGNYVIVVTVKDTDGNSVSTNYPLRVKDPLLLNTASLADGVVGTPYSPQIIPAATGGVNPYVYLATGLPPGLSFNGTTREISGTPSAAGNYTVSVEVKDGSQTTITTNYTIKVVNPLVLPNKTLAAATVNVNYTGEFLPTATGGVGPYTYVAQNVPAEIMFNDSNNALSGIPITAGSYSITLTATDAEGRTATNYYDLTVNGALSLAGKTLPDGTINTAYASQTLPEVSGGVGPYTYTLVGLPAGITFNADTRTIAGTPTVGGNFTLTMSARDANNNTVAANYQLRVTVGDPLANSTTICSGTSTTLIVTNTQANVTYNWYGEQGNTALVTGNNGVFNTSALTANTVFYVEAVSGGMRSNRVAVTVTVNAAPALPIIITNNATVNANQAATLRALGETGVTLNWYAQATGGSKLATGEEFTTPALAANTTYYVESVSALGCSSSSRTPVVVTVLTSALACNVANAQSSGINSLLCVLCNVSNPTAAVDADKDNFTRITLAVGVAATGFQRLIFPSNGAATDSISLDLATPVGLADVAVLGGITVNVLKNNTIVKTLQLNSSLVNLQLLSGARFKATFLAGAEFDRVEIRFQALVAALSSLDIYSAKIIYPKPTITAQNQTICYNTSATLNAVANGGTQIKWYDAPLGGNLLPISMPYTTPNLTASTTYYIEVDRGGCANAERIPVTVNVVPLLPVPTAIADNVTACSGSSAVLGVSNPVTGTTYRWYDAEVDGALLHTGETYTATNVIANKVFYVEAFQNGCVSTARTAIAVTVAPRPVVPQLRASVTTVKVGQTAVLTATSTQSDVDFNWYSSRTSSSPLYSGDTFVTPPLNATTSYYVETVSRTTGCASATRVMVTVNVDQSTTPSPVPCVSPVSQEGGISGIALLAGVSNGNLAIDNETETGSTLFLPVGALNASVYQTLIFGEKSKVGDTVKVLLSSPGKLLSLGVLSSVQLSTLNGTVANNDVLQLDNSLIQLELLSGGSQALVSFVPTKVFDKIEVRLNSGLVTALSTVNVNYARRVIAAPTVTSSEVAVCANGSATLIASNAVTGYTYKWYDKNGLYLASGTTYTTSAITAATKFYVTVTGDSGCESGRTLIDVVLLPLPEVPVLVSNNVSTCTGEGATLQVKNPVDGVTYKWYNNADVLVHEGSSYTLAAVTQNSSYNVRAVSNECATISAPVAATITVGTLDAPVVAASNVNTTANTAVVLSASSSTPNAVINWYNDIADITPRATGNSFLTDVLSANKTYYVEAAIPDGCKSTRIPVTVTIVPAGDPGAVPCNTAATSIAAGAGNIALLSGVYNPEFAVDAKIETSSSLFVGVGLLGGYAYQRVGFTGLSNIGDTVHVHISSPSKLLSLGVLSSVSVSTYNGATENNDLIAVNDPLIKLELLSDGSAGVISFVPTKRFDGVELRLNGGLASVLTSLNLNYVQRVIQKPDVLQNTVSTCVGTSAVLNVKNPIEGIIYKWYLETTYKADGAVYNTPTDLVAGTYNYYVRAFSNNCESAAEKVVVTILPAPNAPTALSGNPVSVCFSSSATFGVTTQPNVTYNWYDSAGELLVQNNDSYTIPNTLPVGVYNYFVEAVNENNCSSSLRTTITFAVTKRAVQADIQITGITKICGGNTVLTASSETVVSNAKFTWYSDAAYRTKVNSEPIFNINNLTANATYYVTVSGDGYCENLSPDSKVVTVEVNPLATAADITVTPSQSICGPTTITLTASSTTVINPQFEWYTNPNFTGTAQVGASITINELSNDVTYYVAVSGDNKCRNAAGDGKSTSITYRPRSIAADISITGSSKACVGSGIILTATSTTVTNPIFTWYADAALTNILYVGVNYSATSLTANTTFYVTVKGDNKCENLPADAASTSVEVFAIPDAPTLEAAGTNVCVNNATTLTVASPLAGVIYEWYGSAIGGTPTHTGTSFTTPSLGASVSYWVQAVGTLGCTTPSSRTKVDVTVNAVPNAPAVVASNLNICINSSATLKVSNPVTGVIYKWFSAANAGTELFTGDTYTTDPLAANSNFYVEARRGDCISTTRTAVSVTVNNIPAAPSSVTAANNQLCVGAGTVLTINNPAVGTSYRWYTTSIGGTAVYEGNVYATPSLTATTTYYVEAVVTGSDCTSTTRASVTVTVLPVLSAPVVTVGTVTHESIQFNWSEVTGATVYEVSTDGGANWLAITATTYTVTNLARAQSVTLLVRAKGALDCQTSANSNVVTDTTTDPFKDSLYVPNTFTPNGDGNNDIFYGYGNNVGTYKMRIYNQWGNLIFESSNIGVGWDGSDKGTMQPNGVYVYAIDVTYNSGISKSYKGTVTLIR